MVVVGAEQIGHPRDVFLVLGAEDHTGVVMHCHLAGDGRAGDGRPLALVRQFAEFLANDVGQDVQGAVLIGLHALGDRQDLRSGLDEPLELLGDPVDAEAVHAAHDQVGVGERLLGVGQLVGGDAGGNLEIEVRVDPGGLDGGDDLFIEVGAHECHGVAVVGQGRGQCGGHDACAEDCDLCHASFFLCG